MIIKKAVRLVDGCGWILVHNEKDAEPYAVSWASSTDLPVSIDRFKTLGAALDYFVKKMNQDKRLGYDFEIKEYPNPLTSAV